MSSTEQEKAAEQEAEPLELASKIKKLASFKDEVIIGGEDFVHRQTGTKLADLDAGSDEFRKACDAVRIYIGTLLKTDQVSLLLGAGCSRDAGGVLLGSIPYEVERHMLEKGLTKDDNPEPWLELFYSVVEKHVDRIIRDPVERAQRVAEIDAKILQDGRHAESVNGLIRDFGICQNFEKFLCKLHTWSAGFLANEMTVNLEAGDKIIAKRNDLQRLIEELTAGLAAACVLPRIPSEDSLRHHRLLIQRLLTRPLNLRRVGLFTLNYDTLIEQATDSCGVVAVDGFVGNLRRIFRPESYDHDLYFPGETTEGKVHRLDRVMHLYKLHGSVTWRISEPSWHNPYGLYAVHQEDSTYHDVLIYPTPLKQGQALGLPYSEMFRRFASNVVRPQSVLFVLGYGFGDDHVNAVIRQALAVPSFTLVIVDPNPVSPFVRELLERHDKRVWVIKGSRIGTFSGFIDRLLPDLDEEAVLKEVIKTYKALDPDWLLKKADGDGYAQ